MALHGAALFIPGLLSEQGLLPRTSGRTSGTEAPSGVEIADLIVLAERVDAKALPAAPSSRRGRPETQGAEGGESETGAQGIGTSPTSHADLSILSEIRGRIERAKRYPQAARRMKLEGRVTVRFTLDRSGGVADAVIDRSSGSALLDEAALETIRRGAPYPVYDQPLSIVLSYRL